MPNLSELPIIIIDSREKTPLEFKSVKTIVKKLDVGDYGLLGAERDVCVERKSLADLYGSLTRGSPNRDRFFRELDKMSKMRYISLTIETGIDKVWAPGPFIKYKPACLMADLVKIQQDYRIPINFCTNRTQAKYWIERFLLRAHRKINEK